LHLGVDDDVTSAPVTTAAHLEKEMVFTDSASDHGTGLNRIYQNM